MVFSPVSTGSAGSDLEIHSNDPDEPVNTVALQGVGLEPPRIAVIPDSLEAALITETARRLSSES